MHRHKCLCMWKIGTIFEKSLGIWLEKETVYFSKYIMYLKFTVIVYLKKKIFSKPKNDSLTSVKQDIYWEIDTEVYMFLHIVTDVQFLYLTHILINSGRAFTKLGTNKEAGSNSTSMTSSSAVFCHLCNNLIWTRYFSIFWGKQIQWSIVIIPADAKRNKN